tara:strand:- start:290 stop:550 length:261 start_codon:yes stop_codon:yes gene_type:complete
VIFTVYLDGENTPKQYDVDSLIDLAVHVIAAEFPDISCNTVGFGTEEYYEEIHTIEIGARKLFLCHVNAFYKKNKSKGFDALWTRH